MTRDAAFLEAIRAAPDDDAPRLIYADWLDERGDPRGEFIRVQCGRVRLPETDPRRAALAARARELLEANWGKWVVPLGAFVGRDAARHNAGWVARPFHPSRLAEFRRGFIDRLPVEAGAFVAGADALIRLAPLRHVSFWGVGLYAAAVAASPHVAGLETLGFVDYFVAPLTAAGARALAASPHLGRLRGFYTASNDVTDDGARALAAAPWLAALDDLSLIDNGLTAEGVRSLAAAPSPLRLISLSLDNNPIGDEGAEAIAACRDLARLTYLGLKRCDLGPGGVAALAASPHLAGLTHLRLSSNRLGDDAVEALTAAPFWLGLRRLEISDCGVSDAVLARLRARFGRV
jgi:uncharacterized protein (TIGR02996 family)